MLEQTLRRIDAPGSDPAVWICRVPTEAVLARADELDRRHAEGLRLSLLGIPFAVKDNIDVAGMPTTAACPAFAYTPTEHAPAVQRLLDAGAVLVGKTNLDQFATGLTGTRSPHGAPRCVFHPEFISGGSSSGSAVAVARGSVYFALGTDTAGSGRVPAAFNDIVGLKPTRGRVSTRGVVPACRSLDCVSIFARTSADAAVVLEVLGGFDSLDPFSRPDPPGYPTGPEEDRGERSFRFGVPAPELLHFFGDRESERLYAAAIDRVRRIGGTAVEIDYAPFAEAAGLLYEGAWVAEREAAVGEFLLRHPSAANPVVRSIVLGAGGHSAADAFRTVHRLAELKRLADAVWRECDVLLLPTTGTIYRVSEVLAEPYALNSNLGYYTNFMNLLDLCGLALPAGFRVNTTPFGITVVAPAFHDAFALRIAARYEESYRREVKRPAVQPADSERRLRMAVVGAHLSGEPLNHQLTGRGARLVESTRTAPVYRLFALAGGTPAKPGLVYVGDGGCSIEVEVWVLAPDAFGEFVAEVPAPLAIGTLVLEDGSTVSGFVCEPRAISDATEITHFGGWRAYRRSIEP